MESNILGIEDEFRRNRPLLDIDVSDAVAALIAFYEAEVRERRPPPLRIGERSRKIFDEVKKICEWRNGKAPCR